MTARLSPPRRSAALAALLLLTAALWPAPTDAGGEVSLVGEWRGTIAPNRCDDGGWTGEVLDFCLRVTEDRDGRVSGRLDWWEFDACDGYDFTGLHRGDKVNLGSSSGFGIGLTLNAGSLAGKAMWGECPQWALQLSRIR